ncbi:restriction endonuclease [Mycolicibacterium agri]|nr:restriction endonuclease [Mycolicibacterium agri]
MKRISADAYQALRDALPSITWHKRAFESFLRDALRSRPELLAGLDFNGATKRETADALISRLGANEGTYQQTTIDLMLDVAAMTRFPDVEKIKEPDHRELRLQEAHDAVGRLRTLTARYRQEAESRERSAAAREAEAARHAGIKQFSDELRVLRDRYVALHGSSDPHQRGKALEVLLTDLFLLFDMEPRLSYNLAYEQIDGSLSFDTDDYIVEARWRQEPTGREHLDVFKTKVERKGRNALGIFVSVNAFSSDALAQYGSSSPFVVFTGEDLFMVLDGRIGLDDLLRAKKRHVNETGDCCLPARNLLVSSD